MHRKTVPTVIALAVAALLALVAAAGAAGCNSKAQQERPPTSIVLPEGNPMAGRQVFMSLGCALCHRAAGDTGIPEPASAMQGPELGPAQAGRSTEFLVDSILNPSHRLPVAMQPDVESPMIEYTDITFRQLSDVVAYIRYLGE